MPTDADAPAAQPHPSVALPHVRLYFLGQARVIRVSDGAQQELRVQPKPLYLLAYLALNGERSHRREALQALFWPDKSPRSAANNLRQALWHLRQALPSATLQLEDDQVAWNPASPPWVDALVFEAALAADDLDTALQLYAGPLLPDDYDEWAQLERERLHLCYLEALERRAHRHYEARRWQAARADAETLATADPLNEAVTRLTMACHWALDQREAARRCYDAYREHLDKELAIQPLVETQSLYQRILRGEAHPDWVLPSGDAEAVAETTHLSLLETLGAFNRGLERATTWAAEASGSARALALHWQGRFCLRLGRLTDARATLADALSLADTPDLESAILIDLATTETGLGNYLKAKARYARALDLSPLQPATRLRLLCGLGGLQGRLGRASEARLRLEEATRLAREQADPALLATASGNLGILLLAQGEAEAAAAALDEGLVAARQADAHWLTAHITGHLGLLAQDQNDLEAATRHYRRALFLAETIGDQRCAALWTLNLGVVRYEQGRYAEALPLLIQGHEQAAAQKVRSLEAGANIFIGACLVAQGEAVDGLAKVEAGLALAREIGDQERILIGLLHQGRALAALGRLREARAALLEGLRQTQASRMHRLEGYLRDELKRLSTSS